jgi:tetratricopeptide (TPR) repeat protein
MDTHSTPARRSLQWIAVAIVAGLAAGVASHQMSRHADRGDEPLTIGPQAGMPGAPPTSADGLRQRVSDMERRLQEHPQDAGAAVLLADALLRQARATTDGRPANRAAQVLTSALKATPSQYDALRMLGAIYLSQHRFREALDLGRRARDLRPNDAWNYGVMGDALIELGEYDQAFETFDTMVSMRPSATAYARVAYGRELRGDLEGALTAMRLAEQATAVQDLEAQAWYVAQVGELYLRMGKLDDAEREFRARPSCTRTIPTRRSVRARLGWRAATVMARSQCTWTS